MAKLLIYDFVHHAFEMTRMYCLRNWDLGIQDLVNTEEHYAVDEHGLTNLLYPKMEHCNHSTDKTTTDSNPFALSKLSLCILKKHDT